MTGGSGEVDDIVRSASRDYPKDPEFDVLVVGGGQAGLAMGWHLAELGLRFLVLEAGAEVGDVWRSRWDSLTLFTPAQYDSLPGIPFPGHSDTYPTKDQVADYLLAYAANFELPVKLNSQAVGLDRWRTASRSRPGRTRHSALSKSLLRPDRFRFPSFRLPPKASTAR